MLEPQVTLGLLAGGRASRLGGRDKAWLQRGGVPQVLRIARRFQDACHATLVSANTGAERFATVQLRAIPDRLDNVGPLGGIDALATACETPWLFTLPVDLVDADDGVLPSLYQAGSDGAVAADDDGLQPLIALYRVAALRDAVASALRERNYSVQAMQQRLQLPLVRFAGLRFGNLNTPEDLLVAGIEP